jgi:hemerythrin-like domain-containing protein
MLTATYTLVALSVEQANVRVSLQAFQNYVESNLLYQSMLTQGQVEYVCDALQRLYDTCHWRKIEMFLIPAIRRASRDAHPLLCELDGLNHSASHLLTALSECLSLAPVDSEARVAQFCRSIDAFCQTLLQRLEMEEKKLFPTARAVISGEAWFAVANQMLVHDARRQERKCSKGALGIQQAPLHAHSIQPDLFPATVAT